MSRTAHLSLVLLFNVTSVLSTELLIVLTHFIEDLSEIHTRSSIHLHTDIPGALPTQLAHLLPGRRGYEVRVGWDPLHHLSALSLCSSWGAKMGWDTAEKSKPNHHHRLGMYVLFESNGGGIFHAMAQSSHPSPIIPELLFPHLPNKPQVSKTLLPHDSS